MSLYEEFLNARKVTYATGLVLYGAKHIDGQSSLNRYECSVCHMRFMTHFVEGTPPEYKNPIKVCFRCAGGKYTKQSFSDWLFNQKLEKFVVNRAILAAKEMLDCKNALGIPALVNICVAYMDWTTYYQTRGPMWIEPMLLVDETEKVAIGPKSRVTYKSLTVVLPPELAEICLDYLAAEPGFSCALVC